MGNEQPKKIPRVTKAQIDIGTLKAKIHLQLVRDRKNAEIIKGQKELVAKLQKPSRNKTEELLVAERVITNLKYANACELLASYAATLRLQAHFIAENMQNPEKMKPYLQMIYSLLYAADHMGLSSLIEFKNLMRALNDPTTVEKYVNPQIIRALCPSPSPEELNIYFCEMSERNSIPLEQINIPGHKFTKDFHGGPSVPPSNPNSNFDDLQRKLAQDLKNKFGPGGFGGFGGNNGGFGGQGGQGNQGYGGQGGYGGGGNFNPYQNMDAKGLFGSNNPSNPQSTGPNANQRVGGGNNPMGGSGQSNNPLGGSAQNTPGNIGGSGQNTPGNLGPNFYMPPDISSKSSKNQAPVRQSITSINDIDYYPQMDANPALFNKGDFKDPDFDQICERLKLGL